MRQAFMVRLHNGCSELLETSDGSLLHQIAEVYEWMGTICGRAQNYKANVW